MSNGKSRKTSNPSKPEGNQTNKPELERNPERHQENDPAGRNIPEHSTSDSLRRDFILGVQRNLGNRKAQDLIQNRNAEPDVMRIWPFDTQDVSVEDVISQRNPDLIGDLTDEEINRASLRQKMSLVHLINWGNLWVGPDNERDLQRIWASVFASQEERDQAFQYFPNYFRESVNFGAEIEDLDPLPTFRINFESDVKAKALEYMASNEQLVISELQQIGVSNPNEAQAPTMTGQPTGGAPGGDTRMNAEQTDRVVRLQAIAAQHHSVQLAKDALLNVPVGYEYLGDEQIAGQTQRMTPVNFNPHGRPTMGPLGNESPPFHTWQAVKADYDRLLGIMAEYENESPTLHGLAGQGQIESFSQQGTAQARQMIRDSLMSVLSSIYMARTKLNGGQLNYLDLFPIHHQLQQGSTQAASGINYSQGMGQWTLNAAVEGHQMDAFWDQLLLGSISAAAFMLAEFATAGSATFILAAAMGGAASGAQAGMSWSNYETLANAANTSLSSDTEIVSDAQVEDAQAQAIVDTIMTVYDIGDAALSAIRSARAAGQGLETAAETIPDRGTDPGGWHAPDQPPGRTDTLPGGHTAPDQLPGRTDTLPGGHAAPQNQVTAGGSAEIPVGAEVVDEGSHRSAILPPEPTNPARTQPTLTGGQQAPGVGGIDNRPTLTDAQQNLVESPTLTPEQAAMGERPTQIPSEADIGERPTLTPEQAAMGERPTLTPEQAAMGERPTQMPSEADIGERPTLTPEQAAMGERPTLTPEQAAMGERPTQPAAGESRPTQPGGHVVEVRHPQAGELPPGGSVEAMSPQQRRYAFEHMGLLEGGLMPTNYVPNNYEAYMLEWRSMGQAGNPPPNGFVIRDSQGRTVRYVNYWEHGVGVHAVGEGAARSEMAEAAIEAGHRPTLTGGHQAPQADGSRLTPMTREEREALRAQVYTNEDATVPASFNLGDAGRYEAEWRNYGGQGAPPPYGFILRDESGQIQQRVGYYDRSDLPEPYQIDESREAVRENRRRRRRNRN